MKVPNRHDVVPYVCVSLSRLQNEGSQLSNVTPTNPTKSIKATE